MCSVIGVRSQNLAPVGQFACISANIYRLSSSFVQCTMLGWRNMEESLSAFLLLWEMGSLECRNIYFIFTFSCVFPLEVLIAPKTFILERSAEEHRNTAVSSREDNHITWLYVWGSLPNSVETIGVNGVSVLWRLVCRKLWSKTC